MNKISMVEVSLIVGSGKIQINGVLTKKICICYSFFGIHKTKFMQEIVLWFGINTKVKIYGGGFERQSSAIQSALVRALVIIKPNVQIIFRKEGFLTGDFRRKERRKYGLKKARKASQFSKRLFCKRF